MIVSAGLSIIYRNESILLVHPVGSAWNDFYGVPKGRVEEDETPIQAAIRETSEEVGINVNLSDIKVNKEEVVRYKSKSGKTRKRVHVFPVHINNYSDINLSGPIIPKEMLQREEVDWAGFVSFKEAEDIVLFRFKDYVRSLSK